MTIHLLRININLVLNRADLLGEIPPVAKITRGKIGLTYELKHNI